MAPRYFDFSTPFSFQNKQKETVASLRIDLKTNIIFLDKYLLSVVSGEVK